MDTDKLSGPITWEVLRETLRETIRSFAPEGITDFVCHSGDVVSDEAVRFGAAERRHRHLERQADKIARGG